MTTSTGAVILAAGKASRFGTPKQLLEIQGETLVDRACRVALEAGCSPVLRVLGAHAEAILARPCPAGVHTLVHSGWEHGMGSSLAAGVSCLLELRPELEAIFVLLPDQPLVTPLLLELMIAALAGRPVVLCDHGTAQGPPALFGKAHFPALRSLQGDRGAKSVAASHRPFLLPFPGAAWDIDTPEAWQRFLAAQCGNP